MELKYLKHKTNIKDDNPCKNIFLVFNNLFNKADVGAFLNSSFLTSSTLSMLIQEITSLFIVRPLEIHK